MVQDIKDAIREVQKETLEQQRCLLEGQEANLKKIVSQVAEQRSVATPIPVVESLSPPAVQEENLKFDRALTPIDGNENTDSTLATGQDAAELDCPCSPDVAKGSQFLIAGRGGTWLGSEDRTTARVEPFDPDSLVAKTGYFAAVVRSWTFQ